MPWRTARRTLLGAERHTYNRPRLAGDLRTLPLFLRRPKQAGRPDILVVAGTVNPIAALHLPTLLDPQVSKARGANHRTMAIVKTRRGTSIPANVLLPLVQAAYAQVKNGTHDSSGGVIRAAIDMYLRLDDDDQPLSKEPEGEAE